MCVHAWVCVFVYLQALYTENARKPWYINNTPSTIRMMVSKYPSHK